MLINETRDGLCYLEMLIVSSPTRKKKNIYHQEKKKT